MKYIHEITKGKTVCWFDLETENLGLRNNLPWQVACMVTRDGVILRKFDCLVNWPQGLNVSYHAAIKTRFNPEKVKAEGVDPKKCFAEVVDIINSCDYVAGHNILGFDVYILQYACDLLDLQMCEFSRKAVDTACITKGVRYEMPPKAGENYFQWQHKLNNTWRASIKYSLESVGREYDIPHDYAHLHDALVDLELNFKVFGRIGYALTVPEDDNFAVAPSPEVINDFANEAFISEFQELELKREFAGVRLPQVKIDASVIKRLGLDAEATNLQILMALCREGYLSKIKSDSLGAEKAKEYGERVKYELSIITKLKFTDYFLIIWDVVNFCRENKIAVGLGRGSAAGSLLFYLLGVTGIDPIKFDLLFERFISPSRSKFREIDGAVYLSGSIPDVDLDISYSDRHKVVTYLENKYPNRTAKILNLSTLTGKTLVKEAGKLVYGKSEQEMKMISDMVPVIFGVVSDIENVYKEDARFRAWCEQHPRAYKIALKLRDLIKHKSVHASGLAMSYDSITESCPIERAKDGQIVCSFNMDDMGETLVKIDLLGLKTLSIIDGVCKDVGITMDSIDFEDPDIYTFIRSIDHFYGLFQIGDNTAYGVTKRLKPESIRDMSAIMALARPGALQSIVKYVESKNSGVPEKLDDALDPFLKETHGQIIYQETLMAMLNKIGFSLEEGYLAIKIVGKKQIDKVKEWESKIFAMAEKNGFPRNTAKAIWDSLNASASYSFNKCIFWEERVELDSGKLIKLKTVKPGMNLRCYDTINKYDRYFPVKRVFKNRKMCFNVSFENHSITCSIEHKLLTRNGQKQVADILHENAEVLTHNGWQRIISIRSVGVRNTIDLEIASGDHNFYCNGIVVSNSHSVAYSAVCAITAYLKHKYPLNFFLHCLNIAKDDADSAEKIARIYSEMKVWGIKLLPPDLALGNEDFVIEGSSIRYGLSAIKGVSEAKLLKVRAFKPDNANKLTMFQSAKQAGLDIATTTALIYAGAVHVKDAESRCRTVMEAQLWNVLTDREKKVCLETGQLFNYDLISMMKDFGTAAAKCESKSKLKRMDTIRKKFAPFQAMYKHNSQYEDLANWSHERKLLGFAYTKTLKEIFSTVEEEFSDSMEINSMEDGVITCVVGIVEFAKHGKTKNGKPFSRFVITDEVGQFGAFLFDPNRNRLIVEERKVLPKEGEIYTFKIQKKRDMCHILDYSGQKNIIYLNKSDVEKASNG